MKKLLKYLAGLLIGVVNGLFGAGGGMIAVPILSRSLPPKQSHATSIAVIFPLSLFSATLYYIEGNVDLAACIKFIPFGIIGAALGAYILPKIKVRLLSRIFGGFMVWAGLRLILS